MPKKKFISVTEAHKLAKELGVDISRVTIIKHTEQHNLGHQIGGKGGKWVINKEKFRRFIYGSDENPNIGNGSPGEQEEQETAEG